MDRNTGVMSGFSSDLRDASFQLPHMSELVDNDLQLTAFKPYSLGASERCRNVKSDLGAKWLT